MHFNVPLPRVEVVPPLSFFEKCSILDDMPIAYPLLPFILHFLDERQKDV